MFALQAVAVGDEILFDYGYGLNKSPILSFFPFVLMAKRESFTQRFELIKLDENARPRLEKGRNSNSSKKKLVNVKATSKKTGKPPGRPRKYPLVEAEPPKPPKAQVKQTLAIATKPVTRNKASTIDMVDEASGDTAEDERPRPSRKRKRIVMYMGLDGAADEEMDDAISDTESSDSYHESGEGEDDEEEEEEEDEAEDVHLLPKDSRSNHVTVPKRRLASKVAVKPKAKMAAYQQSNESEGDKKAEEDEADHLLQLSKDARSSHATIPKRQLASKTAVKAKPSVGTFFRRSRRAIPVPSKGLQKVSYRVPEKLVKGGGERAMEKQIIRLQKQMKSPADAFQPALEEGKQKQMARKTSGR